MDDLISRQAAIDAYKHAWAKGLEPSQYIEILPSAEPDVTGINVGDMVSRQAAIEKEPGEDVKPIVHAHWIKENYDSVDGTIYKCSNCNTEFFNAWNYCPDCGAKMGEKDKDD